MLRLSKMHSIYFLSNGIAANLGKWESWRTIQPRDGRRSLPCADYSPGAMEPGVTPRMRGLTLRLLLYSPRHGMARTMRSAARRRGRDRVSYGRAVPPATMMTKGKKCGYSDPKIPLMRSCDTARIVLLHIMIIPPPRHLVAVTLPL